MILHKVSQPRDEIDILYVWKKEGGKGPTGNED